MELSLNATTPHTYVDIASGSCTDDTNTVIMHYAGYTGKRLGTSWTAGVGFMQSGSTLSANTWYHVYVIGTAYGATNMIAVPHGTAFGYPTTSFIYKRYIGSLKTDSSSYVIPYEQKGNIFLWLEPVLEINGSYTSTARSLLTINIPPGVVCEATVQYTHDNNVSHYFTCPSQTDEAVDGANALATQNCPDTIGSVRVTTQRSNTSSQIGFRPADTVTLRLRTKSYENRRGAPW